MELSKRLHAAAGLVTRGNVAADIGCDHAYIPIWLVKQAVSPRVIALDINKGPLQRAKEHIAAYGLTDYIETRLSDGAAALRDGEADTLIAAGMGGRLILRILEDGGGKVCRMKEWILQPQSELSMVRRILREQGHRIVREEMVQEDGKFYTILRVLPMQAGAPAVQRNADICTEAAQEAYDKYGRLLLLERNPVLKEFLLWEQENYNKILCNLRQALPDKAKDRLSELEREQRMLEFALGCYRSR